MPKASLSEDTLLRMLVAAIAETIARLAMLRTVGNYQQALDIRLKLPGHILLVDDDELMRRSLALNLEESGYRVNTASSAETAL